MPVQVEKPTYNKPDQEDEEVYKKQGKYGSMYSENYEWNLAKFLKETYGDGFFEQTDRPMRRSLHAHTEFIDSDKASVVAQESMPEKYNSFYKLHLVDFLKSLPEDVLVSLGREGSPVVYLYLPDGNTEILEEKINESMGKWQNKYKSRDGKMRTTSWDSRPCEYKEFEEGRVFEVSEGKLVRMWWD